MTAIPAEKRQKHLSASRELFSQVENVRELANGYEFSLADAPELLPKLAEFVSLEKLCCPFLSFTIEIAADAGPVSLRLTGRDGVKAFIREEVSGLLGLPFNDISRSSPNG
jgi:hypothetical protein